MERQGPLPPFGLSRFIPEESQSIVTPSLIISITLRPCVQGLSFLTNFHTNEEHRAVCETKSRKPVLEGTILALVYICYCFRNAFLFAQDKCKLY